MVWRLSRLFGFGGFWRPAPHPAQPPKPPPADGCWRLTYTLSGDFGFLTPGPRRKPQPGDPGRTLTLLITLRPDDWMELRGTLIDKIVHKGAALLIEPRKALLRVQQDGQTYESPVPDLRSRLIPWPRGVLRPSVPAAPAPGYEFPIPGSKGISCSLKTQNRGLPAQAALLFGRYLSTFLFDAFPPSEQGEIPTSLQIKQGGRVIYSVDLNDSRSDPALTAKLPEKGKPPPLSKVKLSRDSAGRWRMRTQEGPPVDGAELLTALNGPEEPILREPPEEEEPPPEEPPPQGQPPIAEAGYRFSAELVEKFRQLLNRALPLLGTVRWSEPGFTINWLELVSGTQLGSALNTDAALVMRLLLGSGDGLTDQDAAALRPRLQDEAAREILDLVMKNSNAIGRWAQFGREWAKRFGARNWTENEEEFLLILFRARFGRQAAQFINTTMTITHFERTVEPDLGVVYTLRIPFFIVLRFYRGVFSFSPAAAPVPTMEFTSQRATDLRIDTGEIAINYEFETFPTAEFVAITLGAAILVAVLMPWAPVAAAALIVSFVNKGFATARTESARFVFDINNHSGFTMGNVAWEVQPDEAESSANLDLVISGLNPLALLWQSIGWAILSWLVDISKQMRLSAARAVQGFLNGVLPFPTNVLNWDGDFLVPQSCAVAFDTSKSKSFISRAHTLNAVVGAQVPFLRPCPPLEIPSIEGSNLVFGINDNYINLYFFRLAILEEGGLFARQRDFAPPPGLTDEVRARVGDSRRELLLHPDEATPVQFSLSGPSVLELPPSDTLQGPLPPQRLAGASIGRLLISHRFRITQALGAGTITWLSADFALSLPVFIGMRRSQNMNLRFFPQIQPFFPITPAEAPPPPEIPLLTLRAVRGDDPGVIPFRRYEPGRELHTQFMDYLDAVVRRAYARRFALWRDPDNEEAVRDAIDEPTDGLVKVSLKLPTITPGQDSYFFIDIKNIVRSDRQLFLALDYNFQRLIDLLV